jgi:hypothetical protein
MKTLVIVLSETRASELTFDSFKKNVIEELNADLCVCIGVTPTYNYDNPYYKLAKHRFLYDEPKDFGEAFDKAYEEIIKIRTNKYEKLGNTNALYGKISAPNQSSDNITYHGEYNSAESIDFDNLNDDEIVFHTSNFANPQYKGKVYGIKKSNNDNFILQNDVNTYKRSLHWREFLKLGDQFWGGVVNPNNQHPGSAGILIFFRWFLLKKLIENDLISEYDRFIITRSDYIYQLPHPKVELLNKNFIWIPDCEKYGGYTDRHVVLSKNTVCDYLNIFNNFCLRSNSYYHKMATKLDWNLEQLIKFHLQQNNVEHIVKEFPYVMYSVRTKDGTTRWKKGDYNDELGYCIKYQTEYDKSTHYRNDFENSGLEIDEYYKQKLFTFPKSNNCLCVICLTPSDVWLEFLNKIESYDVYLIVDDNSVDYKEIYKDSKINIIQIKNEECKENGFIDMNFMVKKEISGWDKAVYYFSNINTKYDNVWFLEDDVFIYDENTLLNMDLKYLDGDLISNRHGENKTGVKDKWHWHRININTTPPYYLCMCCAIRVSKLLLSKISDYATENKTLYFLEALFPTICRTNSLVYHCPEEFKNIVDRRNYTIEDIDKVNLYHPIKDFNVQKFYRNIMMLRP